MSGHDPNVDAGGASTNLAAKREGRRPVEVVKAALRVVRQQAAVHEQVAADQQHHRMSREKPACSS